MNMIYLNNAATSYPKAPGVAKAVQGALDSLPGAANRGGIEDFDVLAAVRTELAALMGITQPERIALGANATWALNLAIHGLCLGLGLGLSDTDTVLTTTAEHNSVLRPLYSLQQSIGVKVHYLPVEATGRVNTQNWQQALATLRPRLCVVTQASNVTGAVNDIAALAALAHQYGATILVDMAQSLGCVDTKLQNWQVDLAAFTGHKYLLGPQGTGGLYVSPEIELQPYLTGGTGIHSDLDTMPPKMPLRLEAGTGNEPGYYGLLTALRWQRQNPWPAAALAQTLEQLKEQLRGVGAKVIDPGEPCTPVVSFTVEGFSPAYIGQTLQENYDIIVRTGLHCAPRIFTNLGIDPQQGTVRASLSRFSTAAELEELTQALREIRAAGPE